MSKKNAASPSSASTSAKAPTINERLAEKLVMDLMAIPGKSGEEGTVSEFITEKLIAAGADPAWIKSDNAGKKSPHPGNTGNLILKLPGTSKAPRRMLSAHMDTVPLCVGCKPKKVGNLVRSADPTTALGGDNRAGCGTILTAALEILKNKLPHPPLTFVWFVQEEIGLQGARALQTSLLGKPAMCFNWDGGAPGKLTIGATGGYRLAIEVTGIASHAGVAPEQGVSAIAIASLAIAQLQSEGWHGLVVKGKDRGTTNVGVFQGGDATNVVTDRVSLRAEARSHDPKFRKQLVAKIEEAFERAAMQVKNAQGKRGSVAIEGRLDYESFLLDQKDPSVSLAAEAVSAEGEKVEFSISNGGLDANWINAHGIAAVSLGCGQSGIHMTSEQLDLQQYLTACRIACRLATAE